MKKVVFATIAAVAVAGSIAAAAPANARENDDCRDRVVVNKNDDCKPKPPKPPVPPVPPAPVVAHAASPLPLMQQYGIRFDATCDPNFTPEWAAWPGAPEGGWSKSWAEWSVEKIGGFVCTRTLVYSNSANAWVVQ